MIPFPPAISAAGFNTTVGGGTMSPAAREAMAATATATWLIDDLQAWAGEAIARHTGAEAGWVSAGAAAGLTEAMAACIAGRDPVIAGSLPHPPESVPSEVVIQRGHRNAYDRALRTAGATIVEAGYPWNEGVGLTYEWELEAAIGDRTAAVYHLAVSEPLGIPLRRVCEIAAERDVPVIVDAAAELPPSERLRTFTEAGAAIVCFSGGKALRGPQAAGLVAGRADLISAIRIQAVDLDVDPVTWFEREGALPPHHGIGRSMKVGKEEIAGVIAALEEFVTRDHQAEAQELGAWLADVSDQVGHGLERRIELDSHFYPRLVFEVGEPRARAWSKALAEHEPKIVVPHHPLARGELAICPEAVTQDDRQTVVDALNRTLPPA